MLDQDITNQIDFRDMEDLQKFVVFPETRFQLSSCTQMSFQDPDPGTEYSVLG